MKTHLFNWLGTLSLIILINYQTKGQHNTEDKEKRQKIIANIESYVNLYKTYSKVKTDYYIFYLSDLDKSYFPNNPRNKQKFFSSQEIIHFLEDNHQDSLIERLKKSEINLFRSEFNRYFISNDPDKRPWQSYPFAIVNDSIINLKNCFWAKEENKSFLLNANDTVKKYDPWNPIKRPKKEDIGKEYIIRYYNSSNPDFIRADIDSFQKKFIERKNKISSDIYGLVSSDLYKKQEQFAKDVPDLLKNFLNDELDSLKEILPTNWKLAVSKMKISYTDFPQQKFWFYSDIDSIYISPYLIRSIYMKGIYERFRGDLEEIPRFVNLLKTSRAHVIADYLSVYESLKTNFQRRFIFILLHELGHPYFSDANNIEAYCDCKAVEIMLEKNLGYSLGIFEQILIQSIKEGELNYWKVSDQIEVLNRLGMLKDDKGQLLGVRNCEELK